MNSDFHYFGTGTAARAAGLSIEDAKLVANAAQFTDYFDSNYWSNWVIVESKEPESKELLRFAYPHLSTQTIGVKMAMDYDEDIWNAFHFPPGNHSFKSTDSNKSPLREHYEKKHLVREVNANVAKKALLCRPYSQFVVDMVEDTVKRYKQLLNGSDWEAEKAFIAPQQRYFSEEISRKKLALMFLGIRMHVLADTWAHQDFTGVPDKHINGAGVINEVYATLNSDQYEKVDFSFSGDCAAAVPIDGMYMGHGQMGHYPDFGWLKLMYPAAWINDGASVTRDNPQQYMEAWMEIAKTIASCFEKEETIAMPENVKNALTKKFKLNKEEKSAPNECENNWAADAGKELTQNRWGSMQPSEQLGIKPGWTGQLLPTTRLGDVWIVNGSTLHLFELASVIHYQWCVKWAKENPEFDWTPALKEA